MVTSHLFTNTNGGQVYRKARPLVCQTWLGRGFIITHQDGGSHCSQFGQFTVRPFAFDSVISWLQRFGQVSSYRLSEFVQLVMVKYQVSQKYLESFRPAGFLAAEVAD